MRNSTKLMVATAAAAAACLLSYDAYAGNLRSNGTPAVEYWFATVSPDVEISYSGGSTSGGQPSFDPPMVLLDDIVYTGRVEPGENTLLLCSFQDQCAFWKPGDPNDMENPGTLDFGPLFNSDNDADHTDYYQGEGFFITYKFREWKNSQTDVTTKTRGWWHTIGVRVKDGPIIDQLNLIGSNTIAVKERREIFGQTNSTTTLSGGESDTTGDSGIGLGIGVGVGATSFMQNTTAHRAYQTPYIVDGDEKLLVEAANWQWAKVILHGRIVREQDEFPIVAGVGVGPITE